MASTRGMALTNINKPVSFSTYLSGEKVKNKLMNYIPDPTEQKMFIAGLSSAVSENPKLMECDYGSIVSAGLKCVAMGFMPGSQTGDVHLVPFGKKCVMIPGYRGYVRLALRSEKVKFINMDCVREGQTIVKDFIRGQISIEGEPKSPDAPVIGYFAFIELLFGFQKTIFWTKERAIAHAEKHAKTPFSGELLKKYEKYLQTGEGLSEKEIKETEGPYYASFDKMSMKNCLRELLLGWAPLSISEKKLIMSDGDSGYEDEDEEAVQAEGNVYAPAERATENVTPEKTKEARKEASAPAQNPADFFVN